MRVTNITCTFSIKCPVSFTQLKYNKNFSDCEFKRNFVVWRLRKPSATALLFEKGSFTMSGTSSMEDAKRAARRFCRKLQKLGYTKARLCDFKVRNIALCLKLGKRLDLTKLSTATERFVIYDQENSNAALVYGEGSKRFRIFPTGTIILTGYCDEQEAKKETSTLYEIASKIEWT